MRKSSCFALTLLFTGFSAHAADLLGVAPALNAPRINVDATADASVSGSVNSRDATDNPRIPVSAPLQSAAPIVDTSVSDTAASTPKVRGDAGASITTTSDTVSASAEPFNAQIYQRDRNSRTPTHQTSAHADAYTTSAIRQALVKSKLSTTARNIKIVTTNGRVNLSGPVKTQAEKTKIESVARVAAGAVTVDSQLNVKATTD